MATVPLHTSHSAAVTIGAAAQTGDVRVGDVTAGDKIEGSTIYHGAPPEQLLGVIADALADEQQYRRLEATAREKREDRIDARLERIAGVLTGMTAVLAVEAVVLLLFLVLLMQVAPRLIASL